MNGHDFLKQKRTEQGLSLRAMDELSGVSFRNIKTIEDGLTTPSFDNVLRILNALGIPMSEFLKAVGYEPPKRGKSKCRRGDSNPHYQPLFSSTLRSAAA